MAFTEEELRAIHDRIDLRLRSLELQRDDSSRLGAAIVRLTEGQAMLTEGQTKLEAAVARLTEGQAKLEAAVARLTEGQAKLFEGQAKLEAAVARLFDGMDSLRKEVASLSQNVGFGLEELARTFLPAYLEKYEGIQLDHLDRAFLPEGSANPEEVDLLGTARRGGEQVTVVVECKGRIYAAEATRFLAKLDRLRPVLPHPPYAVMVGYVVHPSARPQEGRIRFVTSHQL